MFIICQFLNPRDINNWSHTSKDFHYVLEHEIYTRAVTLDIEEKYPASLIAAVLHRSTSAFERLLGLTPDTYSRTLNRFVPSSAMRHLRHMGGMYINTIAGRIRTNLLATMIAEMPHPWDETTDSDLLKMMDLLLNKGNGKPGWYVRLSASDYMEATIHGSCELLDMFIAYDSAHGSREDLDYKVQEAFEEAFGESYEDIFEHLVRKGFKPSPPFLDRSIRDQYSDVYFSCMLDSYDFPERTLESCFQTAVEVSNYPVIDLLLQKGLRPSYNVIRSTLRSTNKELVAYVIRNARKEDLLSRGTAGAAQLLGRSSLLQYAKNLLAQCPELATATDNNSTNVVNEIYALHDTVHLPIVKLLINRGALSAQTPTHVCPLSLRRILRQRHVFVLKTVLTRQPTILNDRSPQMRNLFRALLPAESMTTKRANDFLECVKYLKKHGREMREEDFSWATVLATAKPLHNCQSDIQGLNDLMWYLMQNGAKAAYDDLANCPRSLLDEIALPLLRESGIVATPDFKAAIAAAFRFACRRGSWVNVDSLMELFPRLVEKADPETGDTPLHLAVLHFIDDYKTSAGYVELIACFLLGCPDVSTFNVPLLIHDPFLIRYQQYGRPDKCNPVKTLREMIVDDSIDVHARNKEGKSPLDHIKEATASKEYDWDGLARGIRNADRIGASSAEAVREWTYLEYCRQSGRQPNHP